MNLIDRDKLIARCTYEGECLGYGDECKKCNDYVVNFEDIQEEPTINAIEIPDKATNGDVLMKVLPIDWESKFQGTKDKGVLIGHSIVFVNLIGHLGSVYFSKEWWDAPYKAESEVNADDKS